MNQSRPRGHVLAPQPATLTATLTAAPTVWRQRPSQREAVRVANGARPRVERANAIAALALVVLPLATLVAIFLRGAW